MTALVIILKNGNKVTTVVNEQKVLSQKDPESS